MVEIADIIDRGSLEAWLNDQPDIRAASNIIAHRTAMRVLPLAWNWFASPARKADVAPLSVLRVSLTSGVVCSAGTPEVRAAAYSAARSAVLSSDSAVGSAVLSAVFSADSAAASAADSAAASAQSAAFSAADIWPSIRADCANLIAGVDLTTQSLWPTSNPQADQMWQDLKSTLQARSTGSKATARGAPALDYTFWINWYDHALAGTETRWDMLTEVALLDDKIWQGNANALMDEIHAIERKHATAATPYAERIEENPDTHKLRSVPLSQLPADRGHDIADRLRDAAEIIPVNDPSANAQYASLGPDIEYLKSGVEKYHGRPARLYDVVMAVTARLEHRIQVGDCPTPEQDVLIGALRSELLSVTDDLRIFDPEVRNVVEIRQLDKADKAQPEDKEALAEAAKELSPVSEGALAQGWREDAYVLRDPMATPQETRQAIYRISSRIIRVVGLSYKTGNTTLSEVASLSKNVGTIVKNSAYVAVAYKIAVALFS